MNIIVKLFLFIFNICSISIFLSESSSALDSHKIDINTNSHLPNKTFLNNNQDVSSNKESILKIKNKKEHRSNSAFLNEQTTLPLFVRQTIESNGSDTAYTPDFDGSGGSGPAMTQDEGMNKQGYYRATRGYRLEPEIDVPAYVRQADKTYPQLNNLPWLNIGLESRTRFELYDNDYRPWAYNSPFSGMTVYRRQYPESLWLERTRGYIGVKDILDPLRFVLELQDSREFNNIPGFNLEARQI